MKRGRLTDSGHLRRAEVPHSVSVIKDKLFHIQKQLFKKQKAKLVFLVRFFGQGRAGSGAHHSLSTQRLWWLHKHVHTLFRPQLSLKFILPLELIYISQRLKLKKKKREFLSHHPLSEESDSVSSRPPREPFSLEFVFYLVVQFRDQLLSD